MTASTARQALTDETGELLRGILSTLERMPQGLRQALQDHLWSDIPVTVEEYSAAVVAAGGQLSTSPTVSSLILVTSIIAVVPAGATATLTLGNGWQLPLPEGVTVMAPIRKLLGTGDQRILTVAGAGGPAALWLMGEQRPTYGVLAN